MGPSIKCKSCGRVVSPRRAYVAPGVEGFFHDKCRPRVPACAASMGCLCAGHARGEAVDAACDTTEECPRCGERADCWCFAEVIS